MMNKKKTERKERNKKDKEWAKAVKQVFHNKCAICGSSKMLNAHHIIPREIAELRHDIQNGIALCPKHHRFSFEFSAHQNSFVFYLWLMDKYPIQYDYLKNKAESVTWL